MTAERIERDSLGDVRVPESAYYGAQTQRALENFSFAQPRELPAGSQELPPALVHALGLVKFAAAMANRDLGELPANIAHPIMDAAREVAAGKFDDQFPLAIYQTGSGTSSNMNANEVISNRAIELVGGDRQAAHKSIHPNDHVNRGQSTNDIFPTAIHVAASLGISRALIPALQNLQKVLTDKAGEWSNITKIGRTHLNDAVPLTLGQACSGFARQLELSVSRAARALESLRELPAGGTAVGTGLNTHPEFGRRVASVLSQETGLSFVEAENHFEANAQRDALVECSGELRSVAVTLFSVANNIRWLASGPRCGFQEIILPDLQPGSSIMPGKVNPVMSESLMQIAARVLGHDQTIAFCGASGGQFELNIMMTVMGATLLESIYLLAGGTQAFTDRCAAGMQANAAACERQVERSLSLATGLNPLIGYDAASAIVKSAGESDRTIREVCEDRIAAGTLLKSDGSAVSTAELQTALAAGTGSPRQHP